MMTAEHRRSLLVLFWLGLMVSGRSATLAATRPWEHSSYRVSAHLAIEAPGGLRSQLQHKLREYIEARIDAAIGPIWELRLTTASGDLRGQLLDDLAATPLSMLSDERPAVDKWMLLSIRFDGRGYRLQAREFDHYVERWGVVLTDHCSQHAALGERLFQLMWRSFSPLTRLSLDPEDDKIVLLEPMGMEVPRRDKTIVWVAGGDVLVPVLRRTTRDGELIEGGMQTVPWTYVVAEGERGNRIVGRVFSHTKRPFGVRRRGRVEQVAIVQRFDPTPVILEVHDRAQPETHLAGYKVFAQDIDGSPLTLVGVTNPRGRLSVPPGATRVRMVVLKNGGQLLAKLPVVPGLQPVLEIPLPNDDPRLRAEAALTALRESLIDVIARRSLLMSQAERDLGDRKTEEAEERLRQLDELPGRAHFNRELSKLEQLHKANDRQIQARIDKLFRDTRGLLGRFLDVREVTELRNQLTEAQKQSG